LLRIVFFSIFFITALYANSSANYISLANDKKLFEDRYWHLLLHTPTIGGVSEIDDERFFLAKDGFENPKAELEATIDALYNETSFDDNATACRFPARKEWLIKTLDLKKLPQVECTEFDSLVKRMDPQSASLVFPFAHVNSPASMFGHTFIRIDSSYESKMLSYAINYAAGADPEKENGFLFAIKGLVGGYHGNYSLLPYYEKLKEYRDSDQRDIWEYDLDLSRDEVLQMVRHIWELKDTYSWYYFFDENCSYNMLWLIEVAREDIHLREYFTYYVIPPETVQSVYKSGIASKMHYRPSKRTTLLAYEDVLTPIQRQESLKLARGEISPESIIEDKNRSQQSKRYVLEAASELNQYNYMNGKAKKDDYLKYSRSILSHRASLGKGEELPITQPDNPLEGHQATRIMLQTGWRNGTPVQFAGWRPANHDLLDSEVGYLRGTQIEFLDTLLRYEDNDIELEKLTLLSIASIAPRTDFFKPFSWRMKSGWDTNFINDRSRFMTSVGAGLSWGNQYGYVYFTVDPLFYLSSEFNAGIGGSVGAALYESKMYKTNIEGTHRFYDNGQSQWLAMFSQNIRVYNNLALKLQYDYIQKDASIEHEEWNTFKISLDYFF
jgi:hypothetical protein